MESLIFLSLYQYDFSRSLNQSLSLKFHQGSHKIIVCLIHCASEAFPSFTSRTCYLAFRLSRKYTIIPCCFRWLLIHASCTSSALPKTHRTTGLAHSKSSRSSFRLKKTLSSLSTIPTSPIISKVMSIGIIRSDMLPLRAKALPMLPVRLRHAADHLAEHENTIHFVFLDRVPGCIALVI